MKLNRPFPRFAIPACTLVLGTGREFVSAFQASEPLSPLTARGFVPDGQIGEFINFENDSQEYFVVSEFDPDFGMIKCGTVVTPGVSVGLDMSPFPGSPNAAGPTGFRDSPAMIGATPLPTGFNVGRAFVSYNPDVFAGEGGYFVALDISAPEALDSIAGTQPIAFDVDGDGSRVTQTEIKLDVISEAPLTIEDTYVLTLDTDADGHNEVRIRISELAGLLPLGAVAIDPEGVPQIIDGFMVRRFVVFQDLTGTLSGTPPEQALIFLDSNMDGALDHLDFGIDDDVELAVRNLGSLPNMGSPTAARFRVTVDSFDDEFLGGGAEDVITFGFDYSCLFAPCDDCNGNQLPDACDIAAGTSSDCQPDGVPDECACNDNDPCTWTGIIDGQCVIVPRPYGDVAPPGGNGTIDVDDILCELHAFVRFCDCGSADLAPCAGDGIIDVDDILAVLEAFVGIDPCGCDG